MELRQAQRKIDFELRRERWENPFSAMRYIAVLDSVLDGNAEDSRAVALALEFAESF